MLAPDKADIVRQILAGADPLTFSSGDLSDIIQDLVSDTQRQAVETASRFGPPGTVWLDKQIELADLIEITQTGAEVRHDVGMLANQARHSAKYAAQSSSAAVTAAFLRLSPDVMSDLLRNLSKLLDQARDLETSMQREAKIAAETLLLLTEHASENNAQQRLDLMLLLHRSGQNNYWSRIFALCRQYGLYNPLADKS
jgi:hypothetical protein